MWSKGVIEKSAGDAIAALGIAPDFICKQPDASWIHRRSDSADWYFVALDNAAPVKFEASFRQTGRIPEVWDAETGAIRDASAWREEDGRTIVSLDYPISGSSFVVFRKGRAAARPHVTGVTATVSTRPDIAPPEKPHSLVIKKDVPPPLDWEWRDGAILAWQPMTAEIAMSDGTTKKVAALPPAGTLVAGPWQVSFPAGWDAPASATFDSLIQWNEHDDNGIKYFSGTATYRKKVSGVRRQGSGERVMLDLGDVKNFAEVTVNGKKFPVLWRPPFRVDVTDVIGERGTGNGERGVLDIEIKVTNLWPNRLIGDDRRFEDDCEWTDGTKKGPKDVYIKKIPQWVREGKPSPTGRHTFTTFKHWSKEDDLLPSGLLGPVTICFGALAEDR